MNKTTIEPMQFVVEGILSFLHRQYLDEWFFGGTPPNPLGPLRGDMGDKAIVAMAGI
jgi:hypothetical protein